MGKSEEKMKISVVTPYYKGLKTIFKTINSVFASANLVKDIDLEYVVIIDSMEDKDEAEFLLKKEYSEKLKIIKNDVNLGVAESRNKVLKMIDFDFILFLDQDDLIDINYFSEMRKGMESNADMIVSNAYVVNAKNNKKVRMYNFNPRFSFNKFLKGNRILSPGQVMFSRKIKEIDNLYTGCSENYKGADDWAAYLNIFVTYGDINIFYIKEPIFYYILHENNYSKNWKELNLSAVETARFFREKVDDNRKEILDKQIEFLLFENECKDENYKVTYRDINKLIMYYTYNIFDYNKITHYMNKKLVSFNK